jgi:hypothetical protein
MALGDECPAIKELKSAIKAVFPSVECGTIRWPTPADRHTSGIAMDVMLDVHKPDEKARAEGIIEALMDNYPAMQWSDIIYTDINADGTIDYYHIPGGGRGYGGRPLRRNPYGSDKKHTNHFHIDWVDFGQKNEGEEYKRNPYKWTDAARKTGFATALVTAFKAIPATPAPTAGTPAWLAGWWKVVDGGGTYFYRFSEGGLVVWQEVRPANSRASAGHVGNRGKVTSAQGDTVQITWNWVAGGHTVETFKTVPGQKRMDGTSNRWGPLVATRIE